MASKFIFRHRGSTRTAVLLPGWATDWRIFAGLDFNSNYILPREFSPACPTDELSSYINWLGCGPVVLVGWSMGGFLAVDFASAHPDLVQNLVLIAIRRRYPENEIQEMRRLLESDREVCLAQFYKQCFLPPQVGAYRHFRRELMPHYLEKTDAAALQDGLNYLSKAEINHGNLLPARTTIVHGAHDVIAPASEARWLAERGDRVKLLIMEDAAHAAHLGKDFESIVESSWDSC